MSGGTNTELNGPHASRKTTTSIFDLLLKARGLKLEKPGQFWQLKNARKKDREVLEEIGFKPEERIRVA